MMIKMLSNLLFLALTFPPGLVAQPRSNTVSAGVVYKFDFGPGKIAPVNNQILPETVYTPKTGYGFHDDSLQAFISAADRGGSNGYRHRAWKQQLQIKLVDALGLTGSVSCF